MSPWSPLWGSGASLWAHRLDMMREYEAIGERVAGNQPALLLAAAALAAMAVVLAHDGEERARRGC
ncbi:MAG: hypothetical protein HS111_30200 [Kofleriaceae bacterium]|nr:hypothetical protein [Kofleriaceae bacterium]